MTNDEKRAIIEAATPGPWYVNNCGDNKCWCRTAYSLTNKDDAEFIVAARNEWPKDLERVEELEKENIELRQRLEKMKEMLKDLQWDAAAYCPICGKGTFEQPEGEHYPGCKLAALLREEQPCD